LKVEAGGQLLPTAQGQRVIRVTNAVVHTMGDFKAALERHKGMKDFVVRSNTHSHA
jgi:hypothetical protein